MDDLREQPVLKIKPEEGESFLPNGVYDIIAYRYFPVLSLTYIASVLGMAIKLCNPEFGFFHYFFASPEAYRMGYWVAAWVSVPAAIWILIHCSFHLKHLADLWYKVTAALMILILLVSFLLFPMGHFGFGLRLFLVATVPIFIVQYYFFVRGGLPAHMAWPLMVAGLTFFVYGLIL